MLVHSAFHADDVRQLLRVHSIKPEYRFVAKAGPEYGYVHAWTVVHEKLFLLETCRHGERSRFSAESVENLASWLVMIGLDPFQSLLQQANLFGIDHVPHAQPDAAGPFFVLTTTYWDASFELTSLLVSDAERDPIAFRTYDEAQSWVQGSLRGDVRRDDDSICSRETTPPSYKIVVLTY